MREVWEPPFVGELTLLLTLIILIPVTINLWRDEDVENDWRLVTWSGFLVLCTVFSIILFL